MFSHRENKRGDFDLRRLPLNSWHVYKKNRTAGWNHRAAFLYSSVEALVAAARRSTRQLVRRAAGDVAAEVAAGQPGATFGIFLRLHIANFDFFLCFSHTSFSFLG